MRLLKKHFPDINIVKGTNVESPEVFQMFIDGAKDMLTQPQMNMANKGRKRMEQ